MTKFSVLISVYHRETAAFFRAALESVIDAQTVTPTEVVIVKDGPLTADLDAVCDDVLARHAGVVKIVPLPRNVGLGAALNAGLAECTYELVARMDSDDIAIPERFEKQLSVFENNPDIDITGGWIDEFSDDPSIIESSRRLPETNEEILQFAKSKSPLNHVTVMFKKTAVLSVGSYQPFYLLEDYWLWIRMLKAACKFYNIQETLVLVRGGAAMAARRGGFKYAKSEVRLQCKMYQLGVLGMFRFVKNIAIRFTVRMMPNALRNFVYKRLLRK